MRKNNLFLDIHILQVVPPCRLNADDLGGPKTAIYGGTTRVRVSSQAWKHAVREMFQEIFSEQEIGIRTKKLIDLTVEEIRKLDPEANAEAMVQGALKAIGVKLKKNKGSVETSALFFVSQNQIKEFAKAAMLHTDPDPEKKYTKEEKEACKNALKNNFTVDQILFGRMVATEGQNDGFLNYDACVQVAHAISTHAAQTEYDYFTALDDCSVEENTGAGHLGTTEFNSSTLYRYATVNIMELAKTFGANSGAVAAKFADAFIRSMPSGKQNSFANRSLPFMVYMTLRNDQPINMAEAFENAVRTKGNGYAEPSAEAFKDYADQIYASFVSEPEYAVVIGKNPGLDAKEMSLPKALEAVAKNIEKKSER